jgi:hypothetical protein
MKREKLILEFSEFNQLHMGGGPSMGITTDNSLSINAYDRYQDTLQAGMARLNNIMKALCNTSAYRDLKSKLNFENQRPDKIKILRIAANSSINYDVYISFVINEIEYDAVIKDVLSKNIFFKSNVFETDQLVQSADWQIKLKGMITNAIKKWLTIDKGEYKVLTDKVICFNALTGGIKILKKDDEFKVIKTLLNDAKIMITIENNSYFLTNSFFVYFNYWFEKINTI